jgi:hypothetical protein
MKVDLRAYPSTYDDVITIVTVDVCLAWSPSIAVRTSRENQSAITTTGVSTKNRRRTTNLLKLPMDDLTFYDLPRL